jgi:hypothetical protein
MIIKSAAGAMLSASALAACAPSAVGLVAVHDQHAAAIHTSRCGGCHQAPAPGSHTRMELESAFTRHHKRVHLSTEEWQAMVDYLAADGKATAQKD